MADHFIDGIRLAANRSNEASGRSWHIPAESEFRRPSFVLVIIAAFLGVCLIGSLLQ